MVSTTQEFRQEVIQALHTKYPKWRVEPVDQFAISVEADGRDGRINLENLYRLVQIGQVNRNMLVEDFLSRFVNLIRRPDDPLDSFDDIKNQLTLVVRPTDLYRESLTGSVDGQLAFSCPILPDIALYWVVNGDNTWQYISHAHFSKWHMDWTKVMWWAYKNTCLTDAFMNMEKIEKEGLLISTARKHGTIAHLLWEPRNLLGVIQSIRPNWPEQPYWVCIPVPHLIIVTKEGYDNIIREIAAGAHDQERRALSNRIYVFENLGFTGEVVRNPGQKEPTIVDLKEHIPEPVLPD